MIRKTPEEEILQYIKENPGCTKTAVIKHMEKIGRSSLMVAHKKIKRLEREKDPKIIVKIDESNSQKHHLYINNENEFNVLSNSIDDKKIRVHKLTRRLEFRLYIKERMKDPANFDDVKQDYFNLLHHAQLTNYIEITSIANKIDKNIMSQDDQETLKLKLTELLNFSDKFNKILAPEVEIELKKILDKLENDEGSHTLVAMVKDIASLFATE